MSRPKSWTVGYARAREQYNLRRALGHDTLARSAEATRLRYEGLYDWPSLFREQAAIYRARASWWGQLAARLEAERAERKERRCTK